jgi:hypothetical protein
MQMGPEWGNNLLRPIHAEDWEQGNGNNAIGYGKNPFIAPTPGVE